MSGAGNISSEPGQEWGARNPSRRPGLTLLRNPAQSAGSPQKGGICKLRGCLSLSLGPPALFQEETQTQIAVLRSLRGWKGARIKVSHGPVPFAGPGRGHSSARARPLSTGCLIHSGAEVPPESRPRFYCPPGPQPFSPNPYSKPLLHCPDRNLKKAFGSASTASMGPVGKGRFGPGPSLPAPSCRRPSLLHLQRPLQPRTSGPGPTEPPTSGQGRLRPARVLHFRRSCTRNLHAEKAGDEPSTPRVSTDFVSSFPRSTPRAGSGNVPADFSHPREPSSTMGPYPKANPDPSPGPARPPTESEWPASQRLQLVLGKCLQS